MVPNQIAAIVLSILVVGAGAGGAAQVMESPPDITPPLWADDDDKDRNINITIDGNVTPGELVTVTATHDGAPVPYAPVEVNDEHAGKTDATGQLTVRVPGDAEEFEVEIEPEYEGELTVALDNEPEDGDEEDEESGDEARLIDIAVEGNVTPNETVTLIATVNGTPLPNAAVTINGEHTGTTDANGSIEVTVPDDADEFEVEIEYDESGKLKVQLAEEEADDEDEQVEHDDEPEREDDEVENNEEPDEAELEVAFDGTVSAGDNVTITATNNGTAVGNAMVYVNDEEAGRTDANGQLTITVPEDTEELEIEVKSASPEGEWEYEIEEFDYDIDRESDD